MQAWRMVCGGLVLLGLGGACSGKDEQRAPSQSGGSAGSSIGADAGTGATASGTGGRGGSSSGGKGSGGGALHPDQQEDLIEFYRALYVARCNFDQRCTAENGHAYVSMEACLADVEYTLTIVEEALLSTGILSFLVIAPSGDYQACAETIYPTDSCDEVSEDLLSPECESVIMFVDPLEIGSVCYADGAALGLCGPGNRCLIEEGCGHCEARPNLPDGAACTLQSECAGELCVNDVCATPKPRGAACASVTECRGYLRCVGEPGARVCDDARDEGQPCDFDSECVNGLSCLGEPGTCTLDAPEGTACDRTGGVACGFQCVFASADASTGACGVGLPGLGEPCAYSGENPLCREGYPKRTLDVAGLDTSCVCSPREPTGGPCRASADCESFSCTGDDLQDPTVLGTCDPLAPIGADCVLDEACESGFCDTEGLCAAVTAVCE